MKFRCAGTTLVLLYYYHIRLCAAHQANGELQFQRQEHLLFRSLLQRQRKVEAGTCTINFMLDFFPCAL